MGKIPVAVVVLMVLMVLPVAGGMRGIALRDLNGDRVFVDSLLAEGPLVLNFWATWCRPCRIEMPRLQSIHEDLAVSRVHFAAISLDTRRNKSKVEAYIEQNGVSLPVYRDPGGALARRFKVMAIPTTILLDQDGEIAYRTRGYRPGDEILLKKEIEALLKKRDGGGVGDRSSQ